MIRFVIGACYRSWFFQMAAEGEHALGDAFQRTSRLDVWKFFSRDVRNKKATCSL